MTEKGNDENLRNTNNKYKFNKGKKIILKRTWKGGGHVLR
jgi:hypothetical protein